MKQLKILISMPSAMKTLLLVALGFEAFLSLNVWARPSYIARIQPLAKTGVFTQDLPVADTSGPVHNNTLGLSNSDKSRLPHWDTSEIQQGGTSGISNGDIREPLRADTQVLAVAETLSADTRNQPLNETAPLPYPRNPIEASEISFKILFWQSRCEKQEDESPGSCDIPAAVPLPSAQMIKLQIKGVSAPGEGNSSRLIFNQDGTLIHFDVFSVFPKADSIFPPYVQIQVEIKKPIRAICMQSVRWKEIFEVPSLVCAAYQDQGRDFLKWGVSLTQQLF